MNLLLYSRLSQIISPQFWNNIEKYLQICVNCVYRKKSHGIFSCLFHRNDDVIKWKHFPCYRPVTRSFDVFFDLRLNTRLSKQSWSWWFETPSRPLWRHCNGKYILAPIASEGCCGRCHILPVLQHTIKEAIDGYVVPKGVCVSKCNKMRSGTKFRHDDKIF